MLNTKFQGHRPFDSGDIGFYFFTIYGHGGHLGRVTWVEVLAAELVFGPLSIINPNTNQIRQMVWKI